MIILRLRAICWSAMHHPSRLMTTNPNWDIKALNDEIEGLIGKFDNSADGSGRQDNNVFKGSHSENNRTMAKDVPNVRSAMCNMTVSPPIETPCKLDVYETNELHSKHSYIVFHFGNILFNSDGAFEDRDVIVKYKDWNEYSSLDNIMEDLVNDTSNGIIILYDREAHNALTPSHKNLLKLHGKSSCVVLVVSDGSVGIKDVSELCFASRIILGFKQQDGIAAAIAGIESFVKNS